MLALALQAFAVQTHVHARMPAHAGYTHAGSVDAGFKASPATIAKQQTPCVLCQALAASGVLATASAIAEHARLPTVCAALAIRRAPRAHTHSWQSRAPPLRL